MTPDTSGPAFPSKKSLPGHANLDHLGMTLRDYFAAAALQGLLANSQDDGDEGVETVFSYAEYADWAYSYADAMLKERDK